MRQKILLVLVLVFSISSIAFAGRKYRFFRAEKPRVIVEGNYQTNIVASMVEAKLACQDINVPVRGRQLQSVIREQDLSQSSRFDPNTRVPRGELKAATHILQIAGYIDGPRRYSSNGFSIGNNRISSTTYQASGYLSLRLLDVKNGIIAWSSPQLIKVSEKASGLSGYNWDSGFRYQRQANQYGLRIKVSEKLAGKTIASIIPFLRALQHKVGY